jgi:hypothetical protein
MADIDLPAQAPFLSPHGPAGRRVLSPQRRTCDDFVEAVTLLTRGERA